jgi:DNA-directed RNA polymerase specialized sigma24 family protein
MMPINGRCAVGLFFWDVRRLLAAIIVVRSVQQGELSRCEMRLVRHLHLQFQTALGRLRLLERERAERVALEQFMRRVPLPTALLRWNLKLAYRNQAATEFCAMWERGFSGTRFIKLKAPLPPEIVDRCRVLKKRWKQVSPLGFTPANFSDETVRHPTQRDLRATICLKQISSAAVARPHFLIEFESFRGSAVTGYQTSGASLSHLVRLTSREQNLARLVCDGRSNQEIADESGLSVETVKKHLHSILQAGGPQSQPIDGAYAMTK